jgi:hypothetical protein
MSAMASPASLLAAVLTAVVMLGSGTSAQEASKDARIAVFVTGPMRDGFVDTSREIQDSLKDVRKELADRRDLRLTESRADADIVLTVVARGVGTQAFGQRVQYREYYRNAEMTNTPILANTFWVTAVLEAGSYRKEFTGAHTQESQYSLGAWMECADKLGKDVRAWAAANAEQLRARRTAR